MSPPELSADEVRAARAMLGLSASGAAALVGLNDGAAWRKWERIGVRGPGAVLLKAMVASASVRRYFKIGAVAIPSGIAPEPSNRGACVRDQITTRRR